MITGNLITAIWFSDLKINLMPYGIHSFATNMARTGPKT
jgi:hypothetical protein